MEDSRRIIVALDRSSRDEILRLADDLSDTVGMMKVGLQAFTAVGPKLVEELLARKLAVFLDLKYHDIPNTVAHAVKEAVRLGVSFLTVHTSGGAEMMRAAVEAAEDSATSILGVTILTSQDDATLAETGVAGSIEEAVLRLCDLAVRSGVGGVVASPREIVSIRESHGTELTIVTPGIRGPGDAVGDQRRTMTAREAFAAGANYLVVGRPITAAKHPREAVIRLLEE
jgi:orotidine-5'-phosphate decarboxylase